MTIKPGSEGANAVITIDNVAPATTETTETTTPPTETKPQGKVFSEEEVEAIRRQEKDKLYSKLEKLESQLSIFHQEREEAMRLAEEQAQREAEERRKREEAELSAHELVLKKEDEWTQRFNTAQSEWESKFNRLQEESEAREALLERERQYQELTSYKNRRLAEEQENIMPELMDMVTGNTEEEIESSIQAVVAKTSAIVQSIQQSLPQPPQRVKGIPATGSFPSGPVENVTEQQTFSVSDIANMSMEQYAQLRDRLMASVSPRRGR